MSGQRISVTKKRGRPPGPPTSVIRLPDELLAAVDNWAASEDDVPTRPEAVRRLVSRALEQ